MSAPLRLHYVQRDVVVCRAWTLLRVDLVLGMKNHKVNLHFSRVQNLEVCEESSAITA